MAFVATSSISSTHITAKKIQKHCPPNGFTEEVKFPTDPSNNMFSYVSTKGRVWNLDPLPPPQKKHQKQTFLGWNLTPKTEGLAV